MSEYLHIISLRTNISARSRHWQYLSPKLHCFFSVSALILFAAMVNGCAMPPGVKSLDEILEQEGINRRSHYGYRCTPGAHRGASEEYLENTLAALKAADRNKKYAFIEFDVQYSKDNRIVVYHDSRMLRLFGSLKKIGNTTFEELYDITGGEIAAYDQVMDILEKKINIEIKSQGDNQEDERLADEIIADIRSRKRENDVLISSVSSDVIRYVKENYPYIPTGKVFWLTSSTYMHFDALTKGLYEDITDTRADYLMLHVANLRNIDDLLKFKPRRKTIVFWDFDDTIYIVHKDLSDRLWGDSGVKTFFQFLQYKIISLFRQPSTDNQPGPVNNDIYTTEGLGY
ncbi:MAG TPA: glycerophosphodiester phosphodiesterase family protein [Desulfobacteraceae bacterium]|nr:glycerophosphodiester phosphodiesterase family protein [Desulfobacteraceae bacterium]HPJ67046.1 glycerophosphodiester phosphodiesterase family protein [Desulfobacteraceae bacterium]HPQ27114.1 glycerophosphodiester phosphodiesterase family protein [Desulfobacteraceae bacterium]